MSMSEQSELPSLASLKPTLDFINLINGLDDFSDRKEWEKLGEGGFSTVYKCYFKKLYEHVALKELKREVDESEITVLLKAITSDQIVDIKAVVRASTESPFSHIAMELLPCDLQTLRNNIKISPDRWPSIWPGFVSIMGDICKGLSYLHSHDVNHRDIKPRNILISDSLQAKVSDFGLSRLIGSGSEIEKDNHLEVIAPSGSLPYISPQLLDNSKKEFEKEDDVYSFGLLGYKITTNENLFNIETLNNLTTDMIYTFKSWVVEDRCRPSEDNLSLYKTPEELRNMITSCWDHEVSKRQSFDHWTSIITAKYDEYSEKDRTSANKRLKTAITGTLEDTVHQVSILDDYELLVELGIKLDPPSDTYNDWRGLADKLDFSVVDIDLIENTETNPTSAVLKIASQRKKDLSPETLIKIAEEISRHDVAEIIKTWQDPKQVHECVDIPDSSETLEIKHMKIFAILKGLDVENDLGNDWRTLAGKLGFRVDSIDKIQQTCKSKRKSATKSVLTSACQMGNLTSYKQLITLLTEMKQIRLAQSLKQFLQDENISF